MFSNRINEIKKSAMALVAAGMLAAAMACGGGGEVAPSAQNETESATAVVAQAEATVVAVESPTPFAGRIIPLDTATPETEDEMVDESATMGSDSAGAPEGDATPEPDATAMPDVMPAMNATPEAEATTEAVAVATAEPSATVVPVVQARPSPAMVATSVVTDISDVEDSDGVEDVVCERQDLLADEIDARRATDDNASIILRRDCESNPEYTTPYDARLLRSAKPDCSESQPACLAGASIDIPDRYTGKCSAGDLPLAFWSAEGGFEPLDDAFLGKLNAEYDGARRETARDAGIWFVIDPRKSTEITSYEWNDALIVFGVPEWSPSMTGHMLEPAGAELFCWILDGDAADWQIMSGYAEPCYFCEPLE